MDKYDFEGKSNAKNNNKPMCSYFICDSHESTRTNLSFFFSFFPIRRSLSYCVLFWLTAMWHLQSTVRAPFTSCAPFIYIYSLRSLCMYAEWKCELSVFAHTVVSFVDFNVTAEVCLPILLGCCVQSVALRTRTSEWSGYICGGKRRFPMWRWKETSGCRNCDKRTMAISCLRFGID